MVLRPDERAQEEEKSRKMILPNAAMTLAGGGVGLGALKATGLLNRILPFLNKAIPIDLAVKGASHLSPKIDRFFKNIPTDGISWESGMDYLRNIFMPGEQEEKQEEAQQQIPSPQQPQAMQNRAPQQPFPPPGIRESNPRGEISSLLAQEGQQSESALQGQKGNVDQALLAALEKILQM